MTSVMVTSFHICSTLFTKSIVGHRLLQEIHSQVRVSFNYGTLLYFTFLFSVQIAAIFCSHTPLATILYHELVP